MSPARIRNTVDFPEPEGPSKATTSLGATATEMSSRTRSGLPLGRTKSCETCRASHSASLVISFAQREAFLGQLVAPAPHRTIEGDHEHGHDEDRGPQAGKVGARRRAADLGPEPRRLQRLPLERDELRHDARVPGASGRRDPSRDEIWKHSGEIERAKPSPAGKTVTTGGFFGSAGSAMAPAMTLDRMYHCVPSSIS